MSVIDEASKRTTANYVAEKNDIAIICIQTDPPAKDQLGVKLDSATKQYIGLPADSELWAIVLEINIDTWPSSGMSHIPGRQNQFVYPRPMPGPMMAQLQNDSSNCEFRTGLRPTRLDETGDPHRNLMVRSRALARRLEPWAARPSFETRAQESALLRMRAYIGAKLERNQYFKPLFLFRAQEDSGR